MLELSHCYAALRVSSHHKQDLHEQVGAEDMQLRQPVPERVHSLVIGTVQGETLPLSMCPPFSKV